MFAGDEREESALLLGGGNLLLYEPEPLSAPSPFYLNFGFLIKVQKEVKSPYFLKPSNSNNLIPLKKEKRKALIATVPVTENKDFLLGFPYGEGFFPFRPIQLETNSYYRYNKKVEPTVYFRSNEKRQKLVQIINNSHTPKAIFSSFYSENNETEKKLIEQAKLYFKEYTTISKLLLRASQGEGDIDEIVKVTNFFLPGRRLSYLSSMLEINKDKISNDTSFFIEEGKDFLVFGYKKDKIGLDKKRGKTLTVYDFSIQFLSS